MNPDHAHLAAASTLGLAAFVLYACQPIAKARATRRAKRQTHERECRELGDAMYAANVAAYGSMSKESLR